MKRFLKSFTILLMVLTTVLLFGCEGIEIIDSNKKPNTNLGGIETEYEVEKLSFETDDDVVSFGVLSAASIFGNQGTLKLSARNTSSVRRLNDSQSEEEVDMDLINEYYQMFSTIIDSNLVSITEEESDREEYENKLIYMEMNTDM